MDNLIATGRPMPELAHYLSTRREAVLHHWRSACQQDPELSAVSLSSHEEFDDLAPLVLIIIEQRLLCQPLAVDPALAGKAHGLRRWHRGHTLMEILRELVHLTQTLYDEFDRFEELFPDHACRPLTQAYRQISLTLQEMNHWTVRQCCDLQQQQALNRTHVLEQAVEQLGELAQQRANLLRSSSHDLRSGLSLASVATQILQGNDLSATDRMQFMDILLRNLNDVQQLLNSLMDLSRLETGQESVAVQSVEAGQLLTQLVSSAQLMATNQRITLRAEGPLDLRVSTDPVKLQRIVQNLLTNALKYAAPAPQQMGLVSVSWRKVDHSHWTITVQDNGPGLPNQIAAGLGYQPQLSTDDLTSPDSVDRDLVEETTAPISMNTQPLSSRPVVQGEGVGLQIVRGLCALLGARLDVETGPGQGTLFRIRLPLEHNLRG